MIFCVLQRFFASIFLVGFINSVASAAAPIVCKVPISEKLCFTKSDKLRTCKPPPAHLESINTAQQLDLIFELSPPAMQQTMCDLNRLYISQKIVKHASGVQHATDISLSWEALSRMQRSYQAMLEQLIGGYARGAIFNNEDEGVLPGRWRFSDGHMLTVELEYNSPRVLELNYSFAYLMLHELAHLMGSHPRLNKNSGMRFLTCNGQYHLKNRDALLKKGVVLQGYVTALDHYPMPPQDSSLLLELEQSEFATFYALSNSEEDFAETMAEYTMLEFFGVNYKVLKGDRVLFDRARQFKNANIKPKLDVVKMVLSLMDKSKKERRDLRLDRKLCRGMFDPALFTNLTH